ncbi:MAG: Uncharacterized protein Greene071421_374 [Parcubacteria group bacterium Greene0714_21]|nr:MAG: Uncharacterized protein Greene071421_374 [Parcubacteria group bacterium Greene0714_21]
MTVGCERKLLWASTLIFVASATVFLVAFTFTPTLVSAADTKNNCKPPDKTTLIAECNEIVLKSHPSPVIQEGCVEACREAIGIPARIIFSGVDATGLYCVAAEDKDATCGGVSLKLKSPPLTPRQLEVAAEEKGTAFRTPEELGRTAEKDCGRWFDVGCWVSKVFNAVNNVGAAILSVLVKTFAGLLGELTGLLQKAMILVIESFMGMPVSPSNTASPQFVQNAWTTVRNLTNNFFILILAFIGLATILRLQAYQLQKTLPILLLVALLVNFSGVLVGLVTDVGNIITNNFLDLAAGAKWSAADIPSLSAETSSIGLNIVKIIYYFISSFIFAGVMIAFGLRTIVLWTLAIVSPLAFAAYILPATRRFFTDWWKQLIQWSLFGIPLSFFLYLASLTLESGKVPTGPTIGALSNFLAPFTTLFLLFTGITMSMAMAPAGAQGIIQGANKLGRSMPGRLANTGIGRNVREKLALGTQRVLGFGEDADKKLAGLPGPLGVATRPLGWAMRAPSRVWGGELLKVAARTREYSIPKEFDEMSSLQQAEYLKSKGDIGERAKLWARMIKNDTIKYEPGAEQQAQEDAEKLGGDARYRREVGTWMDYNPARISSGLKISFEPTLEGQEKMKKKIEDVRKELQDKVKEEDITIEARLKLKKEPGDLLTTEELEKFKNDTAAAMVHGAELKPADFARMRSASVRSLPMRLALQKQTLGSIQAIHNTFEADIENEIFNGGRVNFSRRTRRYFALFKQPLLAGLYLLPEETR